MTRFALRLTLPLILLLSAVLVICHARPISPVLDDLLATSPGCRASSLCFMGIYPGSTTMDQAVAALSQHPWVGAVDSHMASQVSWTWSGSQPAYIDASVPGTALERDYEHIALIRVKTRYAYGDIWLQLGTPKQGYAMRQPDGFLHGIYYTAYSLLAINFTECPASMSDFWSMPVIIQFGDAYVMLNDHYVEQSLRYRVC